MFPSAAKYLYYGRYRHPSKTILGNPVATFKRIKFARRNCQNLARLRRAWSFALTSKLQCYIAFESPQKFIMNGRPRMGKEKYLKVYVANGTVFSDSVHHFDVYNNTNILSPNSNLDSMFAGFRGRLAGSRRQGRRQLMRKQRRRARRRQRKRARIAKSKRLKQRLNRRLLTFKRLNVKQILAAKRIKRLKLLGNIKKLKVAKKIKSLLGKRIHNLKREIRTRKLRLQRRYYQLQAAERRAKIRRARRRVMNILKMKASQRLQRLRILGQKRLIRAQTIAKLQRLRRYKLLAKMRAKQWEVRKKMIAQARKRLSLLRQNILLRNKSMEARLRGMKGRAQRLKMLRSRILSRQKRTNSQLRRTKKMLNVISQRMSYYRRLRNRLVMHRLQYYKQFAIRKASRLRLRKLRYRQQLAVVKQRRWNLALRIQRTTKRTRQYKNKMRAFFKKEQQKLAYFLKASKKKILGE